MTPTGDRRGNHAAEGADRVLRQRDRDGGQALVRRRSLAPMCPIPYGVWDITPLIPAGFAVESIRRWPNQIGRVPVPRGRPAPRSGAKSTTAPRPPRPRLGSPSEPPTTRTGIQRRPNHRHRTRRRPTRRSTRLARLLELHLCAPKLGPLRLRFAGWRTSERSQLGSDNCRCYLDRRAGGSYSY